MNTGQTPPPGELRPTTLRTPEAAGPQRLWIADRLDVRLHQGRIGLPQLRGLAALLVAVHAEPAVGRPAAAAEDLATRVRAACAALRGLAPDLAAADERERELLEELERRAAALRARSEQPGPRRLHGALRCAGIHIDPAGRAQLEPASPPDVRAGDPAEDLAALLVPLAAEGEWGLAQQLLAAYAEASGDFALYPVIGIHVGIAALEAARSTLAAATGAERAARRRALAAAERLVDAPRRLAPGHRAPRALVVGGVMASGKSTLAARLAARLSAPRVAGDAVRARLAERTAERGDARLAGFDAAATDEIYARVLRAAGDVLASGRTVVIDASFPTRALRAQLLARVATLGVELRFIECRAELAVVRRRLEARARAQRCDEAEWLTLLERFLATWEPVEELPRSQHLPIDTSRDSKACLERVERLLGARAGPHRISATPVWAQTGA